MKLSTTLVAATLWASAHVALANMYLPLSKGAERTLLNPPQSLVNQGFKDLTAVSGSVDNFILYGLTDSQLSAFQAADKSGSGQLKVALEAITDADLQAPANSKILDKANRVVMLDEQVLAVLRDGSCPAPVTPPSSGESGGGSSGGSTASSGTASESSGGTESSSSGSESGSATTNELSTRLLRYARNDVALTATRAATTTTTATTASTCGSALANAPLHFLSRGKGESKTWGANLQLAQVAQGDQAAAYNIPALQGYNLSGVKIANSNLYLYGTDANQKATLVVLSGVNVSEGKVSYQSLKTVQHNDLTQIGDIGIGSEHIYLLNTAAGKEALLRFDKDFKFQQTTSITGAKALWVLGFADLDNIYVSSSDLSAYLGAPKAGMLLLQKRKDMQQHTVKIALQANKPLAQTKEIVRFVPFANMLAGLTADDKMVIFSIQDGELNPVLESESADSGISLNYPQAKGADPATAGDSTTAPTSAVLGANAAYIYVSSADANSRSILRISRQADLSLSVQRLQKSSEPGRLVDFRVEVKNNGQTDVPLLKLEVAPSVAIESVTGAGASACKKSSDYKICDPAQPLKAGESFVVTFTLRPKNIGTVGFNANVTSAHALKGGASALGARSSIEVGDYHNGTLAISGWGYLGLAALLWWRRRTR